MTIPISFELKKVGEILLFRISKDNGKTFHAGQVFNLKTERHAARLKETDLIFDDMQKYADAVAKNPFAECVDEIIEHTKPNRIRISRKRIRTKGEIEKNKKAARRFQRIMIKYIPLDRPKPPKSYPI